MRAVVLLQAISAALGAYLFFSAAGLSRWIGLAVLLSGAVTAALSLYRRRRLEKDLERLYLQIMDFLERGDPAPFSVNDDSFALLENAVAELENRLLLERENRRKESRKNAAFITDVSHQLKTPLAALKLYSEMDCRKNPGEHSAKQMALIERMEHLIYSLLRLEKLRADAYEMQFTACDLAALARQVWEELQPLYPVKRFSCTGRATLRCDAYWIGEALRNLLKNVCEHTPPDGAIQVSLERSGSSVIVAVADNGGGVSPDELPKLFQRFYRSSRAAPNGGAGLGLAITRTIVEKHHGTVYAENTAEGLKITLCFPIIEGVLAAD